MLPIGLHQLRLFLHVLAATVWVGGQLTLAGLVPGLRALSPDAPRAVARRFNLFAWPAFGVLVLTGIWNLLDVDVASTSNRYKVTLAVKLGAVVLSGVAAAIHTQARSKVGLAVWGALSAVGALAALFFGVVLHG